MKAYSIRQTIGALVILTGVALYFFTDIQQPITLGILNTGTLFMLINYAYGKKKYKAIKDERTIRIGNASLAQSWVLTFFVLNILLWTHLGGLTQFDPLGYFGIIFATMLISANIYNWYYKSKGDIS